MGHEYFDLIPEATEVANQMGLAREKYADTQPLHAGKSASINTDAIKLIKTVPPLYEQRSYTDITVYDTQEETKIFLGKVSERLKQYDFLVSLLLTVREQYPEEWNSVSTDLLVHDLLCCDFLTLASPRWSF